MQAGLDVQKYTDMYKLDNYSWEEDEFINSEKQFDGDFTYLQKADTKQLYDAIQDFMLMRHQPQDI